MRIGQAFGPAGLAARGGVERKSGDTGFAGRVGGGMANGQAAAAGGISPLASLGAVLALQAVEDPLHGRRRARQRGEQLLDALEDVRMALLDGGLPPSQLEALRKMAAEQRGRSDDARLEAVLNEIEVRTAVELAKLERAAG